MTCHSHTSSHPTKMWMRIDSYTGHGSPSRLSAWPWEHIETPKAFGRNHIPLDSLWNLTQVIKWNVQNDLVPPKHLCGTRVAHTTHGAQRDSECTHGRSLSTFKLGSFVFSPTIWEIKIHCLMTKLHRFTILKT